MRVPAAIQAFRTACKAPKDCYQYQGGQRDNPPFEKGVGKGKGDGVPTFVATIDMRNVCLQRNCKKQDCLDANDHPNAKDFSSTFVDSAANNALACQPCDVSTSNRWSPFSKNDDE